MTTNGPEDQSPRRMRWEPEPTEPKTASMQPPSAPNDVPGPVRHWVVAGMFARIAAFMLDILVLSYVSIIVDGIEHELVGDTDARSLVAAGIILALDVAYFIGFWRSGWQATPGMRLVGIRVLDQRGGVLPFDKAVRRWAALSGITWVIVSVPLPYEVQSLLGFGWGLALLISTVRDKRRQGLHDRWAGTVVGQPAGAAVRRALTFLVAIALLVGYLVAIGIVSDQLGEFVG